MRLPVYVIAPFYVLALVFGWYLRRIVLWVWGTIRSIRITPHE
jgi:hypothetical protein